MTATRPETTPEPSSPFSFMLPPEHYYLWHLLALKVITPETGPGAFDVALPDIAATVWDQIAAAGGKGHGTARVALIDVGVGRQHPNLAGRIDVEASIDLVSHPYGAKTDMQNGPKWDEPEQQRPFFTGLDVSGLANLGLDAKAKAWFDELVAELVASQGVVRAILDTDDMFGSHGTSVAGLVVGEPSLAIGGQPVDFETLLESSEDVGPSNEHGLLPYFGVDPLSELISIRTSFEQNAAHFVTAFLYAWMCKPDVILLPRGIPDPVRSVVWHKPELEQDLDKRVNWERADLFARIAEANVDGELRPHAVGAVHERDRGWDVLAALMVAISKSIPIVCAAGNDGESQLIYPAKLARPDNGIIAVGAVSGAGRRSGYSNYGEHLTLVAPSDDGEVYNRHQLRLDRTHPTVEQHAWVQGTAALVEYSPLALLTTDLPGTLGYAEGTEPYASIFPLPPNPGKGGGYYTTFGGTSGASALVAGAAAVVARANRVKHGPNAQISGVDMKAKLVAACSLTASVLPGQQPLTPDPMNADDEPSKGKAYYFGAGLLDVAKAVNAVLTT